MNAAQLQQTKLRVAEAFSESPGCDLDGMLDDIRHALDRSGLFTGISGRKTGSRRHLVETRCRTLPIATPRHALVELNRVWLEELRYSDFEAHAFMAAERALVLDFITAARSARLYVTGLIIVDLTPAVVHHTAGRSLAATG